MSIHSTHNYSFLAAGGTMRALTMSQMGLPTVVQPASTPLLTICGTATEKSRSRTAVFASLSRSTCSETASAETKNPMPKTEGALSWKLSSGCVVFLLLFDGILFLWNSLLDNFQERRRWCEFALSSLSIFTLSATNHADNGFTFTSLIFLTFYF